MKDIPASSKNDVTIKYNVGWIYLEYLVILIYPDCKINVNSVKESSRYDNFVRNRREMCKKVFKVKLFISGSPSLQSK